MVNPDLEYKYVHCMNYVPYLNNIHKQILCTCDCSNIKHNVKYGFMENTKFMKRALKRDNDREQSELRALVNMWISKLHDAVVVRYEDRNLPCNNEPVPQISDEQMKAISDASYVLMFGRFRGT